MTYNEHETTWNNLQRSRNDLKWPKMSKTQPTMTWTYLQRAKKRCETTNNKQIFRLFYNMSQMGFFSNMFSTQHFVAIIRALLHIESWWKQRQASLYYHVYFLWDIRFIFFCLGFVSRTFINHRQQIKGKPIFFSSSLPLPPAS